MTTNYLTPSRKPYKDRLFTTGLVAFPDVKHIADRADGAAKDVRIGPTLPAFLSSAAIAYGTTE